MTTENITIVITLIAIFVGIVGNTWDGKKKGIRKLTVTGWLTIIIGLITSGVGFMKNYQNAKELNWQESQKVRIKKIAYKELNSTVNGLLNSFTLLWYNSCIKFGDSCNISKFNNDFNYKIKELKSKTFISRLDSFYPDDSPENPKIVPNTSWSKLITENANISKQNLNELWLKFHPYFETETVLQINSILNDELFTIHLLEMEATVRSYDYDADYHYTILDNFIKDYQPNNGKRLLCYLDKVKKLKDLAIKYSQ